MLKNDTLKNGTFRIGLYGSAPPGFKSQFPAKLIFVWNEKFILLSLNLPDFFIKPYQSARPWHPKHNLRSQQGYMSLHVSDFGSSCLQSYLILMV